ncbi:hypothetical protein Rcae01_01973 [Novipirellula caenicola]|uniref:Uncharacterized protein n=1 Tax=Novipirellula caenicola TaxID=1536901 RepID=A0ABP9VMU9_9BACT
MPSTFTRTGWFLSRCGVSRPVNFECMTRCNGAAYDRAGQRDDHRSSLEACEHALSIATPSAGRKFLQLRRCVFDRRADLDRVQLVFAGGDFDFDRSGGHDSVLGVNQIEHDDLA